MTDKQEQDTAPQTHLRVKQLEWTPYRAETAFGYYHIDDQRDRTPEELQGRPPFLLSGSRLNMARYDTLEAARAAAQADFERRILSALDTTAPETNLRGDSFFPSKEEIHHLAKLALEEMQREATTDPAAWLASYERVIMAYRRLALSKQQASDSEAWERANEAVKAANALQVEIDRLRSSTPGAGAMTLLRRMSDSMDHMSPDDTIGYTNGAFWIDVATVEEIRNAAYPSPQSNPVE